MNLARSSTLAVLALGLSACFPDFTLKQCYGPGDCPQGQVCRNLSCVSDEPEDGGPTDGSPTDGGDVGWDAGPESPDAGPVTNTCRVSEQLSIMQGPLIGRVALARRDQDLLIGYSNLWVVNKNVGGELYLASGRVDSTPQAFNLSQTGEPQRLGPSEGRLRAFSVTIVSDTDGFAAAWVEQSLTNGVDSPALMVTATTAAGLSVATPQTLTEPGRVMEDVCITPTAAGYALLTTDDNTSLEYQQLDRQGRSIGASQVLQSSVRSTRASANRAGDQLTTIFGQSVVGPDYCTQVAVVEFAVGDGVPIYVPYPAYQLPAPSFTGPSALARGAGDTMATAFVDQRICANSAAPAILYFSPSVQAQAPPVVLSTVTSTHTGIEYVEMAYSSSRDRFAVVWTESTDGDRADLYFAEINTSGEILGGVLPISGAGQSARAPVIVDLQEQGWAILWVNDDRSSRQPGLWLMSIDCR